MKKIRLQRTTGERVIAELGGEMFMTETGKAIEGNYRVGEIAPVIFDKHSRRFLPAYRHKSEDAVKRLRADDDAPAGKRMPSPPIGCIVSFGSGSFNVYFRAREPNDNRFISLSGIIPGDFWVLGVSVLEANPHVGAVIVRDRGYDESASYRIVKFRLTTKVVPEVTSNSCKKYNFEHSVVVLPAWDPFTGTPFPVVSESAFWIYIGSQYLPATHAYWDYGWPDPRLQPRGGSGMTAKQFRVFSANPRYATPANLDFFVAFTFPKAFCAKFEYFSGGSSWVYNYLRQYLVYYDTTKGGWQEPIMWNEGCAEGIYFHVYDDAEGTHLDTMWPNENHGQLHESAVYGRFIVDIYLVMNSTWSAVAKTLVQVQTCPYVPPPAPMPWHFWLLDPSPPAVYTYMGTSENVSNTWMGAGINTGFGGNTARSMMRIRKAADWHSGPTLEHPEGVDYAGGVEGQDEFIYTFNGVMKREAELQQSDFPARPDNYHFGKLSREFLQSKQIFGEKLKYVPGIYSYAHSPGGWVEEWFEYALKVGDEVDYIGESVWDNEPMELGLLYCWPVMIDGEWTETFTQIPMRQKTASYVNDFGLIPQEGWWPN